MYRHLEVEICREAGTIQEDLEETDHVSSSLSTEFHIFYVKYFRLNVMSVNNNKLLV